MIYITIVTIETSHSTKETNATSDVCDVIQKGILFSILIILIEAFINLIVII